VVADGLAAHCFRTGQVGSCYNKSHSLMADGLFMKALLFFSGGGEGVVSSSSCEVLSFLDSKVTIK
jgi:hypothetical protein